MSTVGVPHTEIKAWADNVGHVLVGTEAEWLNKMSIEYAHELQRSSDKDTVAPFIEEDD